MIKVETEMVSSVHTCVGGSVSGEEIEGFLGNRNCFYTEKELSWMPQDCSFKHLTSNNP